MAERPETGGSDKPPPLSKRKLLLFRAACVCLPLFLLALLEGILRLAGLGGYPPIILGVGATERGRLFITDPAGAGSWFFANRRRPGANEQYSFYEPKPARTVRIVLVGESAAKGFPEPRNLAASAFLREMLRDAWPDRDVEVINLGTTAVASYPVLEIMTAALDHQPDLLIAYTGQNEFFGTYGVASIGWAGGKPWRLRATRLLYSLALVQGIERLLPGRGTEGNKTLMEIMMGRSYVGPADWRRQAAANNLADNIGTMIERCKTRGVPLLVCTEPTNERGLAPFGTNTFESLDATGRENFGRLLASGIETVGFEDRLPGSGMPENELTNAVAQLTAAVALQPEHATAYFYLGKALFALGRTSEALECFVQARDLDTMPWRSPSLSQQAIVKAAQEHGAPLCDLEKVFRDASPGGAIGWELMDDHVHPTLRGQALVARSLVGSMTHLTGKVNVSPDAYARLASDETYARRLGDNPFDRYGVAHMMRVIFGIPFMRDTNPQAFRRFDALANSLETNYPPELQAVMRDWQTSMPHAGGKRPLTGMVARVLMREGKYAEALDFWHIAEMNVPDYTSWHMEYVYFGLACEEKLHGALSEAQRAIALEEIKQGRFLLEHGHSDFGLAERYLGRLHQLRAEFAEAIPYLLASRKKLNGEDLVAADQALAVSYLKTGQPEKARQVVENGIAHSGSFAGQYRRMLSELETFTATNHPRKAAP